MVRFCQAPATGSVIPVLEMGSLEAGVLSWWRKRDTFVNRLEMTPLLEKYMVQSLHISLYIDSLPSYTVWLFGICAIFQYYLMVY